MKTLIYLFLLSFLVFCRSNPVNETTEENKEDDITKMPAGWCSGRYWQNIRLVDSNGNASFSCR